MTSKSLNICKLAHNLSKAKLYDKLYVYLVMRKSHTEEETKK